MDWAGYLEHPQDVLKEFDAKAAFIDKLLIYYFQNSVGLLIWSHFNKKE